MSRAAGFILRNGPVTQQDRWEEDAGYSPFTLAVEISGLLAAADLADAVGQKDIATHLRETADCWNDNIERWIYAKDSDLARQLGVEGYYVRIAPPDSDCAASPLEGFVPIKNRPPGENQTRAVHLISPDSLALVRFGLRAPDDPRILNTVKVIDALLKVNLPKGPCWYRYNGDGYGEHEDGSPFDGTGIGRPWPLLAGERAHYELAAGRPQAAEDLLKVMELSTEGGRLIPEQVWDAADIPALELFRGKPTGSACSAGMGTRRVREAAEILARRQNFRPAAADRAALPGAKAEGHSLRMAIQQQMPHHAAGKEAAHAAALAGVSALELRWMADHAGHDHPRPVRHFRRRPAH